MQHRRARTRDVVMCILSHYSSLPKVSFNLKTNTAKHLKRNFFSKSFYYDDTLLKMLAKRVLENLVPLNPNDRNSDTSI